MRPVPCHLGEESLESQNERRRYHPALTVTFTDGKGQHTVVIRSGYRDDITCFQELDGHFYVLSRNNRMPYIGLESFDGDDRSGEVFLDKWEELVDMIGRTWADRSDLYIANALAEYLG